MRISDQVLTKKVSDREMEFEIEKIIKHRQKSITVDGLEFLVECKGYDESRNTWEPASNLQGALEIL